jgi:hypothetical protein
MTRLIFYVTFALPLGAGIYYIQHGVSVGWGLTLMMGMAAINVNYLEDA